MERRTTILNRHHYHSNKWLYSNSSSSSSPLLTCIDDGDAGRQVSSPGVGWHWVKWPNQAEETWNKTFIGFYDYYFAAAINCDSTFYSIRAGERRWSSSFLTFSSAARDSRHQDIKHHLKHITRSLLLYFLFLFPSSSIFLQHAAEEDTFLHSLMHSLHNERTDWLTIPILILGLFLFHL